MAKYGRVPASAAIIFHHDQRIYVMDADGRNRTVITSDTNRRWQHVALAPGRRFLVANYDATNQVSHPSKMVVFDLQAGREAPVVPQFTMAGDGGVDWDRNGHIYFAGASDTGGTDIWRVKADNTGLTRITTAPDLGETDVSVHESGRFVTYNALNGETGLMEIWVANVEPPSPPFPTVQVFTALDAERTVHDPELSPDGQWIVFSMRNPDYHNFPNDPNANTAQDIYKVRMDGSELTRLSSPGPIAILPDWKGTEILHMQMSDLTTPPWGGMVVRDPSGAELRRITEVNMPKWI